MSRNFNNRTYLNGKFIKNLKRLDENTIEINLKNGNRIELKTVQLFGDCHLKDTFENNFKEEEYE